MDCGVSKTAESFGDIQSHLSSIHSWNYHFITQGSESSNSQEESEGEKERFGEQVADNALYLLPTDPFGMGNRSTYKVTGGWIQDSEKDFVSGYKSYGIDVAESKVGDGEIFGRKNWTVTGATWFTPHGCDHISQETSFSSDARDVYDRDNDFHDFGFVLYHNVEEFQICSNLGDFAVCGGEKLQECSDAHYDIEGGAPHDGMFFALGHLGVKDLLSVEGVCKSLRDAVREDPLLWRNIYIDQRLSERITDDALIKLSNRSQGMLQCLSLVQCMNITESGLRQVMESNPRLTKLAVPGCVRLGIEGVLNSLRALQKAGVPGVSHLRIGGLFGMTEAQFTELMSLLRVDKNKQARSSKLHFYQEGRPYLSFDDDRAIDIEACPRCQKLRLIYDCSVESCQAAHNCRGCILCIPRCIHCGCCIKDYDYEETFCLDFLCEDCWKQFLSCEEGSDERGASKYSVLSKETRCRVCLLG